MHKKNEKQWFTRKRYGYGWTPISWQGWLTVVVMVAVIVGAAVILLNDPSVADILLFGSVAILALLAMIRVSQAKGPSAKWTWGSGRKHK